MKNRMFAAPTSAWLATLALLVAPAAFAQTLLPLPSGVEGYVDALAVQYDGKILVGGGFTAVNNIARQNLARLNTDGSLDVTWNPGVDGRIYAFQVTRDTIYVAGCFNVIGGQLRAGLAALDATTGAVKDWDPNAGNGTSSGGVRW